MSPVLMQVQLPVISNELCQKTYQRFDGYEEDFQFDDRVMCTGGGRKGGKDSCQGDSGGPVMLPIHQADGTFSFYQIGIISHSEGCARPNVPGVNTNVQFPEFVDWIEEKLTVEVHGIKQINHDDW